MKMMMAHKIKHPPYIQTSPYLGLFLKHKAELERQAAVFNAARKLDDIKDLTMIPGKRLVRYATI